MQTADADQTMHQLMPKWCWLWESAHDIPAATGCRQSVQGAECASIVALTCCQNSICTPAAATTTVCATCAQVCSKWKFA